MSIGEKMHIKKVDEFNKALPLLEKLEAAGYEAYFVGGCVRDFLLQKNIKDIDITTNATPEQVTGIFKKVIPVGISHGTVIVRQDKRSYEITTFRNKLVDTDDGFTFGTTLSDDLLYRDFTMNALAMDRFGNITDLFKGQDAIKTKTIQAVQNPYMRFKEDPLRMVRACRFVSQLGFTIESDTIQAIEQLKKEIQQVATERLKDEMTALLTGHYFTKALSYLIKTKLINELPIFKNNKDYVFLLEKERSRFDSFAHMIAFCHYLNPKVEIAEWINLWKGSNKEKTQAKSLIHAVASYKQVKLIPWLVYQLDESLDKPFIQIIDTIYETSITKQQMRMIRDKIVIRSRQDLQVDGHTLMKWFSTRKPGPWIEQMLNVIEKAVVQKDLLNDEQQIKEWILCHPLATN